ncbi:hypothetical protein DFH11DRAFT_1725904 [Phellopilus nigrolimitatus]|nr:hypothetical protein DFH11DRAFT_1725904 [Phellopilus nigrolimitatus]
MDKEGILLSQPLRAKVLALEYVRGQVHREVFMAALRDLFIAAGPRFGDEHFLDLLNHLVRAERPMETLESVVRLYIEAQGAGYWLDSMSVAYMIARYHELKNKSDAERWLDYHSQRPCLDNPDITFSYPYSAHVHGLIGAAPEEEPKNIYGPILNRMQRDGAAPDTILINMLIRAELAHGHADSAVALYNVLREHHAQSIFPDETTFSSLFAAAGHRAKRTQDPFPLPPRVLFREMLELHAYLGTARIVTKVSLGAALWQFVVSGDYAGSYIALRTYAKLHIPFEILPIASVSDALVERCRRQLSLNSADTGPAWVDAFLDLRDVNRALLRRETPGATSRRMMDIAKRSLMLSEMADETKSYILQPSVLPVRKAKMNKIRTRRLQLVDTLLLRALAATFHLQPKKLPITTDVSDKLAQKAIEKAVEDMIPPKQSKAPQTKTNPAQEVNDANECL